LEKVCQDISPDLTPVADHKPYDLTVPDGVTRHVAPGTRIASGNIPSSQASNMTSWAIHRFAKNSTWR